MKIRLLFPISAAALLFVFCLSSCDSKRCKCYVYNGSTVTTESEYVSSESSCTALDYTQGVKYRKCLEENDPDIDPGQIGREYKK